MTNGTKPSPGATAAAGTIGTVIGGPLLGAVVTLFMQYGFGPTVEVLTTWKKKNDADPTPEQIMALMEGVKRPEDY